MKGYILTSTAPIANLELRHGTPNHLSTLLHEGKFLLAKPADQIPWYPSFVRLDDADWEWDGTITFHSTKHAHIINKEDLEKLLQVVKEVG